MIGNLLSRYLDAREAQALATEHAKALRTIEQQKTELAALRFRNADLMAGADKDTCRLVAELEQGRKLLADARERADQLQTERDVAMRRVAVLTEAADMRRLPRDDGWKAQAEQDRRNCVEMEKRLAAAEGRNL